MSIYFKKKYAFDDNAKRKTYDGIRLMFDTVTRTLGPNGQNALIDRAGQVVDLTKDGVTVAEDTYSQDEFEEMGCKLAREASQKVNDEAGDGTTTVIVLLKAMCEAALNVPKNASVIKVKRGMAMAMEKCVETIKGLSFPVNTLDEYTKVACISCQDAKDGAIIAKAFYESGDNGSIDIQRGDHPGIEVEKAEGMSLSAGWLSISCLTDARKGVAELVDVPVLVTDRSIKSQHLLIPIVKQLAERSITKLVIVADNIEGDALGAINKNNRLGSFHIIPIKAPGHGLNRIGIMKDIAEATGGKLISTEEGIKLETASFDCLGRADKVLSRHDKTIIVFGDSVQIKERVAKRVEALKSALEDEKETIQKIELEERLANLTDGITTLKVEGRTQQEYRELKFRVEDAVRALHSAKQEGACGGCGSAFLACIEPVDGLLNSLSDRDERIGAEIVRDALSGPSLRILEVAGVREKDYLVAEMRRKGRNMGYDFLTGKIGDMVEAQVWDAAKSVRCALEYAVSAAQSFLTLGVSIANEETTQETFQKLFGKS